MRYTTGITDSPTISVIFVVDQLFIRNWISTKEILSKEVAADEMYSLYNMSIAVCSKIIKQVQQVEKMQVCEQTDRMTHCDSYIMRKIKKLHIWEFIQIIPHYTYAQLENHHSSFGPHEVNEFFTLSISVSRTIGPLNFASEPYESTFNVYSSPLKKRGLLGQRLILLILYSVLMTLLFC